MSFWKDVGDFLDDAGSSTTDALGSAWSFASDDVGKEIGHIGGMTGRALVDDFTRPVGNVLSFPGRHAIDNPATREFGRLYHSSFDHSIAAYGNLISDPNELGVINLLDPSKIQDAWHASGENDSTAGESISQTLAGVPQSATPEAAQRRENFQQSWAGKLSSGAADLAVGWYADPTVVAGKLTKDARIASTTLKGNEERKTVLDYADGRTNAAQAGKRAQKMGDKFNAMIASTDGKTAGELAQHPALKSSADAGALAYLFERANLENPTDLEALHAQKRTIFGAALGDPRAIDRMKAQRSELADEMQRIATPPDPTRFDEAFTWDDHGQGALDLFNEAGSEMDQRLSDQISAKMEKLDRAISASGTTSKVAATGAETGQALRQGYLYSGMAGRPTRILASAASQRLPGYVSLKDPVAGVDEFQKYLKRMVHTAPEVRQDLADQYVRASNAGERRAAVAKAESVMVTDTASHYGTTREGAEALLKAGQGRRATYLNALSGRLYSATDADNWIHLNDPEADEMIAVSKPLARTQIEDMHPVMDPDVVDKFLKVGTHQRAVELFAAKMGAKPLAATTKMADSLATGRDWADDILRNFSKTWKDSALFRLAYPARVQVDTQMRLMSQMGALQWASALPSALKGQGKYLLQGTVGDGRLRSLFRAPEDLTSAMKGTLLKGGEHRGISIAPARDEEEVGQLANRLWSKDGSMADLISETADTELRKARKMGDWGIVEPDHPQWATQYKRAVNRQILESPTMKHSLLEPDDQALKRWVTTTPEGQAEWREMKPGWKNLDDWIAKIRDHTDHYLPDALGLRQVAAKRKLNDQDIADRFDGKASFNRMRVHGEAMSPTSTGLNRLNEKYNDVREGWYRWASEAPETILGRSPLYAHMFQTHMREIIDRLADGADIDEMAVRRQADKMARRDVGRVLFDTSHVSNMATHFRFLSPFFAAWEDTMKKWGGLMYDDPSRAAHLVQVWHAPNNMGLVVDSEGNRVDADGHVFNSQGQRIDTQKGYQGNGQYITIPLPGVIARHAGLSGVGDLRINKDSFNVVFQGEPWWLPGFGPLVQVPANEIVKRAFPEQADNPLIKYVLPFGTTNDSVPDQFAPAWVRQAKNIFGNTQDFSNVYSQLMAQEVVRHNLGERKDNPSPDEIARKTRAWFLMRAITSNAAPVSITPTPRFQLYVDKAHEYQSKYGKDWESKFYQDFPDYFEMATSLSTNDTGITASEQAYDATKRYAKAIGQHPDYGWMFVGPANDPSMPFNSGVYNWQAGTTVSDATTKTYRSKKDPAEALSDIESSKGWIQYQQMTAMLDGVLQQRGLHSLSQKGAEDLKTAKQQLVAALGSENPSWMAAYNGRSEDKVQQLVAAAADGMRQDKSLASRPDFQALQTYVQARTMIQKVLQTRNQKSLDANPDLQTAFDTLVSGLREQNFGFSQMWDRVLEGDNLKGNLSLG